jgi:hypothetical protein
MSLDEDVDEERKLARRIWVQIFASAICVVAILLAAPLVVSWLLTQLGYTGQ